jgi:hypothetical protein
MIYEYSPNLRVRLRSRPLHDQRSVEAVVDALPAGRAAENIAGERQSERLSVTAD